MHRHQRQVRVHCHDSSRYCRWRYRDDHRRHHSRKNKNLPHFRRLLCDVGIPSEAPLQERACLPDGDLGSSGGASKKTISLRRQFSRARSGKWAQPLGDMNFFERAFEAASRGRRTPSGGARAVSFGLPACRPADTRKSFDTRPISLLTLSLLTLLDSNFPGNPLWTLEFHDFKD